MTDFSSAPITDATIAEFTRQMQERGLDPGPTLSAHGIGGQQQQRPAGPASRGLGADLPPREDLQNSLSPSKTPRLSPTELEKAAANLERHWTGDPAVLRDALERAGLTQADDAEDDRGELARDFDTSPLGVPASLDEYELGGLMVNRPGLDVQEALEVSTAVRTTLAELGAPKHLGPALGAAILDGVQHSNAVDGVEDPVRSNEQVAVACRILGVGRQEVFDAIKVLTAKLSPESRELLQHAVAGGHQADLLVWLYRSAELQTVRKGLVQ